MRQVEIVRLGRSRLISPAGHSWDGFFDGDGLAVSADFLGEREQPPAQEREGF